MPLDWIRLLFLFEFFHLGHCPFFFCGSARLVFLGQEPCVKGICIEKTNPGNLQLTTENGPGVLFFNLKTLKPENLTRMALRVCPCPSVPPFIWTSLVGTHGISQPPRCWTRWTAHIIGKIPTLVVLGGKKGEGRSFCGYFARDYFLRWGYQNM